MCVSFFFMQYMCSLREIARHKVSGCVGGEFKILYESSFHTSKTYKVMKTIWMSARVGLKAGL